MDHWEDTGTLAYCGWVCAACSGLNDGCSGCRTGGGDEGCAVRACCVEKGYAGCWECRSAPCERGPFGKPEWRGTTTALIRAAQMLSVRGMLDRVRDRLGDLIDYAALSGLSEDEVLALLDLPPEEAR